ncbi:hypothetical protein [Streptomyces sp. NBC_01244]|uniref:hypothetical protein n=1 Tax=Streptomyces sp. NBC_01244 TaxID=2903797 RepID=UPI002E138914|nr:hypothetical protein OG247_00585 [Streptomyces sp. NBC_01244]
MTKRGKSREAIPDEFGGLIAEFRGLLEKYPQAVGHFSLAYHPTDRGEEPGKPVTAAITQPVFECTEIEPGLAMCERVDEQ